MRSRATPGRERADAPVNASPKVPTHAVLALQRSAGNQAVARLLQRSTPDAPAPAVPTDLLAGLEALFPEAARKVRSCPAALELVEDAKRKGAEFGGYSERGPVVRTHAYTLENRVYIPQSQTDPVRQMNDFLFEINNAARADRLAQIHKDALAGSIDAKTYARRKIEVEVEGILSTGAVWAAFKGSDATLDQYDVAFFLEQHEQFKSGTKTKEQIVDDVLQWRSIAGAAWTNERYYMDQYEKLRSGG
jgi:hypothetical protein